MNKENFVDTLFVVKYIAITYIVLSHEAKINELEFGILMHELIGRLPIGTLLKALITSNHIHIQSQCTHSSPFT